MRDVETRRDKSSRCERKKVEEKEKEEKKHGSVGG